MINIMFHFVIEVLGSFDKFIFYIMFSYIGLIVVYILVPEM